MQLLASTYVIKLLPNNDTYLIYLNYYLTIREERERAQLNESNTGELQVASGQRTNVTCGS